METRRYLGVFAIMVGVLLFIGMGMGVGRAVRGEDVSAFFLTPFLLAAALVCLAVGFHQLWGRRERPGSREEDLPGRSTDGRPPLR